MREDLLSVLRCPESGQSLDLVHMISFFELHPEGGPAGGELHVVEGLLATRDRRSLYAVIDEIPRVVIPALRSSEERDFLAAHEVPESWSTDRDRACRVEPERISEEQLEAEIRRRMERQYELPPRAEAAHDSPEQASARGRCEGEIRYMTAEARGTNKGKYVRLLRPLIGGGEVTSILETGGNFPG
ncbi:MAG: hypothetical protein AAF725_23170, partial [Acidobacteriota bacterium]